MFMPLTRKSSLILPMMPWVSSKPTPLVCMKTRSFFHSHSYGFFVVDCDLVDLVNKGFEVFFLRYVEYD